MRPLHVLLALLKAGTPKQPSDWPQQDPWKRNLTGCESGDGGHYTKGERIRTMCLKESSSDFPTCHPLSHSQSPGNSQHMSNSIKWEKYTVFHGDCNVSGLNLNMWCAQVRELRGFWWGNKERVLGDYYVYMCVKEDLAVHVKCKTHTGGYIFKTKSIELPNQKKKKKKGKENGHLSFRTKINDNRYLLLIHTICPSIQKIFIKAC